MWIEASDGTAINSKFIAGFVIREPQIPDKGAIYVVAALYPTGERHHDIMAYKERPDAVEKIKTLTKELG